MTGDPIGESDLLAYVDGQLGADRRRAVEAWLAEHPEAARRIAADQAINAGLKRLLRRSCPWPAGVSLGRAAAALALLVAGAAGGWTLTGGEVGPPQLGGLERLADGPVVNWGGPEPAEALDAALRRAMRLPDLSSAGLRLAAQAVVGSVDRPTLRLTYEGHGGEQVMLLVQLRQDAKVGFQHPGLLAWAEGPLLFALAGDLSGEELRVLADLVHAAPSRQPRRSHPVVPVASGAGR